MWRDGEDMARGVASRHSRSGFLSRIGAPIIAWVAGPLAGSSSLGPGEHQVLRLLRPHLHHQAVPAPVPEAAADRPARLSAAAVRRAPVDNLGRPVDSSGYALDSAGNRRVGPTGEPVARAPRTRPCQDVVPEIYGFHTRFDGAWYRCCSGQIRKLVDCCAHHNRRINGDAALVGLLLPRPQGVLRPLLRHQGAVLRAVAATAGAGAAGIALGIGLTPGSGTRRSSACALLAGVSGAWSP